MVIQTIKQQTNSDCGLACLAMVSGMAIERFQEKHVELEKLGRHKAKLPWSTNTKDLVELAGSVGLGLRQFRFSSWSTLPDLSIVKVNQQRHTRSFHWVACGWSEMYGPKSLLIHDPAYGEYFPFTFSEHMGSDISPIYAPFGIGLAVMKDGAVDLPITTSHVC